MEKQLELTGGGTLTVSQEGGRARLAVRRRSDGRGLYKVWVRGSTGGRFLLGTLVPEGGMLCLERSVALEELERSHCWPVAGGETVLAFSFQSSGEWARETRPEQFFQDQELRNLIRGPMLCSRDRDSFWLAAPFRLDRPVPLTPLFCLARPRKIGGEVHLVWQFDRKGWPQLPQ